LKRLDKLFSIKLNINFVTHSLPDIMIRGEI